jgi:hypothetical protein
MSLDFEIYDGKKYTDLLKDIVKNHKSKQSQIKVLTDQLVDMVSEPGDAVMVVPLIKGYLDSDIKNDESLVKLAQILQKANQTTEDADGMFSEKDLELLFSDIQKSTAPLSNEELKKLPEIDANKS